MSELALELIREAKEKQLTRLDLGKCGLTEIPDALFELTELEELNLADEWIESNLKTKKFKHGKSTNNGARNQINHLVNIRPLENLLKLNLSGNKVSDIAPLAQLKQLNSLNLYKNKVSDIAPLAQLKQLNSLDFSWNKVSDFAPLAQLKQLNSLDLSYNEIRDIAQLKQLKQLNSLDLSGNKVSDIAPLAQLKQLNSLDLSGNKVSDIAPLAQLKQLNSLNLSYNEIRDIAPLAQLKQLNSLDLYGNKVSDIAPLAQLKQLNSLNLMNTGISDIAPLAQLKQLKQLNSLDLRNNEISDIAPLAQLKQLNSLDLINNEISNIAPLAELLEKNISMRLEKKYDGPEIVVGNNPLTTPPKEVIEQGNQAILTYLRDLGLGTQALNEAKLIIVGEPEAGKTTLMEKLLNPDFKPCENTKSTLGVEVREGEEGWEFEHPEKPDTTFNANIWDFGGQQIQYMTHQFFLTPGAVYVLVSANDRKEPTNFPYWFKIIHLLGEERGEYSPVLVVLNEKDDKFINKFNFDKKFYEERYPELQITTCEVDLSKKDAQYEALRCQVQSMLTRLSHVSNPRPAKWADIRSSLQQRAKTHDHITFAEYQTICEQHEVDQEDSQLLFSRYLHKLGSLLHFSEDPKLHNFIILSPQWAVDAVYSVLNDNEITRCGGEFTREQVDRIWKSKTDKNGQPKYNFDERNKLLSLMEKENFEICYRLDDSPERYIAPQLLNTEQPELNWNKDDNLKFRFRYKFMPEGIITRLIVRKNELIKDNLVWKKGVVLQGENCHALVQEEENRDGLKVIDIAVSGKESEQKFLLREVRKEINDIHHKWFRNIEAEQMIPCNCSHCTGPECKESKFFEYSVLQRAQDHGQSKLQCDKAFLEVPVMGLLEGVFDAKELQYERNRQAHSIPYSDEQAHAQKFDINVNLHTPAPEPTTTPLTAEHVQATTATAPETEQSVDQKQWYKQWWLSSLIPAGIVLLMVGFLTWLWSDSMKWAITAGLISCATAYVMVYLNNPARRFFRAAWFVLLGVFAGNLSLLSGTFGYAQEAENSNLGLAIKWGDPIHIGLSIALILLAALLFYFDHWLERNK